MITAGIILIFMGICVSICYFDAIAGNTEVVNKTFSQAFVDLTFRGVGWLILLIAIACIFGGIYLFIKNKKINAKKKLQEQEQLQELKKQEYKQNILKDKQFELAVLKMENTIKNEKDRYCSYCGAKIPKDSTQCSHCGSAIK